MLLLPKSKKHALISFVILATFVFAVNSGVVWRFFTPSPRGRNDEGSCGIPCRFWGVMARLPVGHGLRSYERVATPVWAEDDVEEIEEKLEEKIEEKEDLEDDLSDLEGKIAQLNEDVAALGNQLSVTQQDLNRVAAQAKELGEEIAALEIKLSEMRSELATKEQFRNQFVRLLYKERQTPLWEIFFAGESLSRLSKSLVYQSFTISDLKEKIANLNAEIAQMEEDRARLAESKSALDREVVRIAALKVSLVQQKTTVETEVQQAVQKRDALSSELADISAEIQDLVRAKLAATEENTSVGDTAHQREEIPDPPFSPAYAVYSRGYPHRVGMNQYGAYGRAKDGQDYKKILRAYYDDIDIEDYDCPDKIRVRTSSGTREIDFEDEYLRGIAEMPSSWGDKGGMEALKAQAIAARSYALAYTDDGRGSICITQSCQVWNESKVHSERAASWHEAVEDTEGKVITRDGNPIKAWYASTAGGATRLPTDFDVKWNSTPDYVKRIWDNPKGRMDNWSESYDKNSPWFYKAWYGKSHDKHPWLKEDEMQDLLNAAILLEEDDDLEEGLVQEAPVVSSKEGWSKEKVRDELEERDIEPVGEIKDIICSDSSDGYTKTVTVISENYEGGKNIDGKAFRKIFVIRSPGYLALWSSLYDVVRK